MSVHQSDSPNQNQDGNYPQSSSNSQLKVQSGSSVAGVELERQLRERLTAKLKSERGETDEQHVLKDSSDKITKNKDTQILEEKENDDKKKIIDAYLESSLQKNEEDESKWIKFSERSDSYDLFAGIVNTIKPTDKPIKQSDSIADTEERIQSQKFDTKSKKSPKKEKRKKEKKHGKHKKDKRRSEDEGSYKKRRERERSSDDGETPRDSARTSSRRDRRSKKDVNHDDDKERKDEEKSKKHQSRKKEKSKSKDKDTSRQGKHSSEVQETTKNHPKTSPRDDEEHRKKVESIPTAKEPECRRIIICRSKNSSEIVKRELKDLSEFKWTEETKNTNMPNLEITGKDDNNQMKATENQVDTTNKIVRIKDTCSSSKDSHKDATDRTVSGDHQDDTRGRTDKRNEIVKGNSSNVRPPSIDGIRIDKGLESECRDSRKDITVSEQRFLVDLSIEDSPSISLIQIEKVTTKPEKGVSGEVSESSKNKPSAEVVETSTKAAVDNMQCVDRQTDNGGIETQSFHQRDKVIEHSQEAHHFHRNLRSKKSEKQEESEVTEKCQKKNKIKEEYSVLRESKEKQTENLKDDRLASVESSEKQQSETKSKRRSSEKRSTENEAVEESSTRNESRGKHHPHKSRRGSERYKNESVEKHESKSEKAEKCPSIHISIGKDPIEIERLEDIPGGTERTDKHLATEKNTGKYSISNERSEHMSIKEGCEKYKFAKEISEERSVVMISTDKDQILSKRRSLPVSEESIDKYSGTLEKTKPVVEDKGMIEDTERAVSKNEKQEYQPKTEIRERYSVVTESLEDHTIAAESMEKDKAEIDFIKEQLVKRNERFETRETKSERKDKCSAHETLEKPAAKSERRRVRPSRWESVETPVVIERTDCPIMKESTESNPGKRDRRKEYRSRWDSPDKDVVESERREERSVTNETIRTEKSVEKQSGKSERRRERRSRWESPDKHVADNDRKEVLVSIESIKTYPTTKENTEKISNKSEMGRERRSRWGSPDKHVAKNEEPTANDTAEKYSATNEKIENCLVNSEKPSYEERSSKNRAEKRLASDENRERHSAKSRRTEERMVVNESTDKSLSGSERTSECSIRNETAEERRDKKEYQDTKGDSDKPAPSENEKIEDQNRNECTEIIHIVAESSLKSTTDIDVIKKPTDGSESNEILPLESERAQKEPRLGETVKIYLPTNKYAEQSTAIVIKQRLVTDGGKGEDSNRNENAEEVTAEKEKKEHLDSDECKESHPSQGERTAEGQAGNNSASELPAKDRDSGGTTASATTEKLISENTEKCLATGRPTEKRQSVNDNKAKHPAQNEGPEILSAKGEKAKDTTKDENMDTSSNGKAKASAENEATDGSQTRKESTEKRATKNESTDKRSTRRENTEKHSSKTERVGKDSSKGESTDKRSSRNESSDKRSSKTERSDKRSSKSESADKRSSKNENGDKRSSKNESADKRSSKGESTEKRSSKADSTEKRSSRTESTEKRSSRTESTEKRSSKTERTEKRSLKGEDTDKRSSKVESTEKRSPKGESTEKRSSKTESRERRSSKGENMDKRSSKGENTDKRSSKGESAEKRSSKAESTEKGSSKTESTEKRSSKTTSTEKHTSKSENASKRSSKIDSTEKHSSKNETTEKRSSKSERTDKGTTKGDGTEKRLDRSEKKESRSSKHDSGLKRPASDESTEAPQSKSGKTERLSKNEDAGDHSTKRESRERHISGNDRSAGRKSRNENDRKNTGMVKECNQNSGFDGGKIGEENKDSKNDTFDASCAKDLDGGKESEKGEKRVENQNSCGIDRSGPPENNEMSDKWPVREEMSDDQSRTCINRRQSKDKGDDKGKVNDDKSLQGNIEIKDESKSSIHTAEMNVSLAQAAAVDRCEANMYDYSVHTEVYHDSTETELKADVSESCGSRNFMHWVKEETELNHNMKECTSDVMNVDRYQVTYSGDQTDEPKWQQDISSAYNAGESQENLYEFQTKESEPPEQQLSRFDSCQTYSDTVTKDIIDDLEEYVLESTNMCDTATTESMVTIPSVSDAGPQDSDLGKGNRGKKSRFNISITASSLQRIAGPQALSGGSMKIISKRLVSAPQNVIGTIPKLPTSVPTEVNQAQEDSSVTDKDIPLKALLQQTAQLAKVNDEVPVTETEKNDTVTESKKDETEKEDNESVEKKKSRKSSKRKRHGSQRSKDSVRESHRRSRNKRRRSRSRSRDRSRRKRRKRGRRASRSSSPSSSSARSSFSSSHRRRNSERRRRSPSRSGRNSSSRHTRRRRRGRSRSSPRSRRSSSPARRRAAEVRLGIDRKKLRRIAILNMLRTIRPGLTNMAALTPEELQRFQAGGVAMDELQEICKELTAKQERLRAKGAEEHVIEAAMLTDEEEVEECRAKAKLENADRAGRDRSDKSKGRDRLAYTITESASMPLATPAEPPMKREQLLEMFPVSSGIRHQTTDPSGAASSNSSGAAGSTAKDNAEISLSAQSASDTSLGAFTGKVELVPLSQKELQAGIQPWLKKNQFNSAAPVTNSIGQELLKRMGWREGEGLGKNKDGLRQPVYVDIKVDRKGLSSYGETVSKKPQPLMPPKDANSGGRSDKHPVSVLLEHSNKNRWSSPHYQVVSESGPSHSRTFLMSVTVNGQTILARTQSRSKKEAKLAAANAAVERLGLG